MNNGCMKESVSKTATIDDVEEETFIAFCEFGYKGRYTTPCRNDEDNDSYSAAEGTSTGYSVTGKMTETHSRSSAIE
jgi:hypothetical protein